MIIGDGIMLGSGGETASIFVTGLSETDNVSATHKIPEKVPNPAWHDLPDGYTQLEYIESTGTQYIHLTSVSASSPVDMKLHVSNFNGGYIVGKSANGYGGFLSKSLYRPFGRTDYQFLNLPISSSEEHHIELGYDYIIIDGVSYSGSSDSGNTVSGEVTLFAGNDSSGRQYASGRIHYAEATQGGFHCVMYAVRRNTDGVLGLYDTIHGVLYTNSGSGSFLAGPEVPQYIEGYVDGKTIIGKWTQKPNPAILGLPDGYTELECIIGGSTQYINTGFTPNQDTRVVLDHKFVGNTTACCGFGSRVSYESRGFQYNADYNGDKNKAFVQYGGTYADAGNLYGTERHIVDFNKNNFYHDDVLKKSFTYTSFTAPSPLYLFAMNQNGAVKDISDMILYRCQIYDNGQIVRDFIPAKRNSDSVIGLCDIVTNSFFENAGTGTFTAGAEVPQTIDGFVIGKIKDYGTWTVTATDGTDTATLDVLVDSAVAYNVEISYRNIDENIVLLIDGNNIEDISTYQRAITNNGVTLSDAQTKFFDKSLYFNGSAILQFDAYTLGTSDFTIDFWMYNTATSNAFRRWITGNNGYFVDGTFCIRETSSGVIQTQNATSSTSVPRNQWVHIAAVRSNGTLKIYLNGTEIASTTDSTNYSEALKYIGGYASSIGNETFQGYMDEIRISNIARWTSNFTPPTRPY